MDKEKADFSKRLAAAMEAAGYEARPSVLEKEFNQRYWGKPVTLHGVRRWLRGEVFPAHNKLITLAEWLRITPEELRFGTATGQKIKQARKHWDEGIGYEERDVFDAFLKLPAPQRKVVREVILAFARAYQPSDKY